MTSFYSGHGMVWNGTEFLVWNMEDARMEWKSSILPYQFHATFCGLYLHKNTYQCPVVMHNIVTEVFSFNIYQRWSRGHKARGQGHKKNPRPRTAFPRADTLEAKDRNGRGQGQGPRTQAQVLSKKKKKVFTKFF